MSQPRSMYTDPHKADSYSGPSRPAPRNDPTRVPLSQRTIPPPTSSSGGPTIHSHPQQSAQIPTPSLISVMSGGTSSRPLTYSAPEERSVTKAQYHHFDTSPLELPPGASPVKGPETFTYTPYTEGKFGDHGSTPQKQQSPPQRSAQIQARPMTSTNQTVPSANINSIAMETDAILKRSHTTHTGDYAKTAFKTQAPPTQPIQATSNPSSTVTTTYNVPPPASVQSLHNTHMMASSQHQQPQQQTIVPPPAQATTRVVAVTIPQAPQLATLSTLPAKPVRIGAAPVTDESLLRDVLWAWIGAERTQHIEWSEADQLFRFVAPGALPKHVAALKAFQSCAVLNHKISKILTTQTVVTSLFHQSLCSALEKHMTDYREAVTTAMKQNTLCFHSLRPMYNSLYTRLSKIHGVLVACRDTKGGVLLRKLGVVSMCGSEHVGPLLHDVTSVVLAPLFAMIRIWITQGEIQDPFLEFFVQHNASIKDVSENYWSSKYTLSADLAPPETITGTATRFSEKLLQDILAIGRTINFVRMLRQASDSCVSKGLTRKALSEPIESDWQDLITAIHNEVTVILHNTLTKSCNLSQHFYVLNYYVLLAKGDFVQLLFIKILQILALPRDALTTTKLRDALTSAVRETMTSDVDALITDRLSIVLDDTKKGALKEFTIQYNPSGVMNNIFDQATMSHYNVLCRHLLKVKLAEWALKEAWRESTEMDKVSGLPTPARSLVVDTHQLWLELSHFVQIYQSYLVHDALGKQWKTFSERLDSTECLAMDDIRKYHAEFLENVMQHSCLQSLREEIDNPRKILEAMIYNVESFCSFHSRLYSAVCKRKTVDDVPMMAQQLKRVSAQYRDSVGRLLRTLEKGALLHYDYLHSLVLGLNFNGYYDNDRDGSVVEEFN